jgi:hypothetical protein
MSCDHRMLHEMFNLDEGPVTFTFPATLSGQSCKDLEDRLAVILRAVRRRAGMTGGGE